ncbi:MAG: hypothetical protein VX768_06125 [Planctomycetota bacterium]|nr:hypothetical protein [Planctomycetota bacterium]
MKKLSKWMGGMVLILGLAGCQTLEKREKISQPGMPTPVKSGNAQASYNPIAQLTGNHLPKGRPDSIVAIWKDATYTVSAQRPTRGFGGRLYFYDREKNPVVVDGELVVYGFADDKYNPGQVPEKRFIFSREELQNHMSVSSVGPSYSVWLPWDHINGEQKNVTIIAVFREAGPGGRVCKSEAIPALLPGKKPLIEQATETLKQEIRAREAAKANSGKIGFQQTKPEGTRKIKTHEIRIPAGSRDRLFGSVPTAEYRLPKPEIHQTGVVAASLDEELPSSANQPPSTGSSPDPHQAQSRQFVRQGKLPPGKQPPRLGGASFAGSRR